MGNAVNFDKIRKRRQRFLAIRRVVVLAGIALLVIGVIFLNSYMVEEGVTTHLSDLVESFGGSGYPASLPGGVIQDVKSVGRNMAVLNDTNLYIYNPKAKLMSNIQFRTENSVMLTSGDRVLTYDVSGRSYGVYSVSKLLHSRDIEDPIITGDLGPGGEFAIVTSPKRFTSEVNVYSRKFEWMFRWQSSENLITELSISPKGGDMAVASAATKGGQLQYTVHLFRLNSNQEVGKVVLADEMVLWIEYQAEDRIAVLTDRRYLTLDALGNVTGSYALDTAPLGFESHGQEALLLLDHRETRSQTLVLLDRDCEEIATLESPVKLKDMALGGNHIYLLTDQGIDVYSRSLELQEEHHIAGVTRLHLSGSTLHYFTRDEICVLGKGAGEESEPPGEDSGPEETGLAETSREREESPAGSSRPEESGEPEDSADPAEASESEASQ